MIPSQRILCLLFIPLCAACAGCGSDHLDLGPLGQVRGVVTHEGEPVTDGFITFNCRESGQVASSNLDSDGSFQMRLGKKAGLPVGQYRVSIRPPLHTNASKPAGKGKAPSRTKNPTYDPDFRPDIPVKYRFETKSGLTAKVVEGNNQFAFDLQDE